MKALPAATLSSAAPWVTRAQDKQAAWRTFETTTRLEITRPLGTVHAWVPLPLSQDTDWFQTLENSVSGNFERSRIVVEPVYRTACADLIALFVGLLRAAGVPARDVYGIRVADSAWGYRSLGKAGDVTEAQHCRAEFYAHGIGWIPVDPADVRKVLLEERPGLTLADSVVKEARAMLWGGWEGNWLGYNYAHDVQLPGSSKAAVPFLMYPQAENAQGRLDSMDADNFKYRIASRELAA